MVLASPWYKQNIDKSFLCLVSDGRIVLSYQAAVYMVGWGPQTGALH